ncbi:hypothetical protein C5142_11140 [Rhodococcus sp. BGS-1C]|uniref:DUF5677 domain-containing protein n=1 Tax=unclassified Rhodococcus (in: high G+C Gram-positive bacteria) TaxID=192944 RepID=UPI0019D2D490|nr:DUF5677 domain-containing protein [Rhodococcus sp. KRD197]
MREVSEFGETLEYRNEELGYDLGRNRIKARKALQDDLDKYVTPYERNFYGYLTVAEHINTESATNWRVSTRSNAKLDILCELHSQALIVAEEVVTLISAGLPTGATARWRTLYEITVTALFIAKSPNMVAERYKHSHIVEQYLRIRNGDTNHLMRDARFSKAERARRTAVEHEAARLETKYGSSLIRPYGWASERLKQKRVTFNDIEKRVMDKQRHLTYITAAQDSHGVRLSSVRNMVRHPESESLLTTGPLDPYIIQVETAWTLQDLTWELARRVHRRQEQPEALYWGYVAYMYALDLATEATHARYTVSPSHLRLLSSISDSRSPKLKPQSKSYDNLSNEPI